jgi:hypothetical protein
MAEIDSSVLPGHMTGNMARHKPELWLLSHGGSARPRVSFSAYFWGLPMKKFAITLCALTLAPSPSSRTSGQ